MRMQERTRCRSARPTLPPTRRRSGALRSGRRATRPSFRPGARRTAPTASFSTSPARRICSAERNACLPICGCGWTASACRRGLPSPAAALRLSCETRIALRRLGFRRIGALIDKPRAPFAARFEKELLLRLDQALGRAAEPLRFVCAPPAYHSVRYLPEPVVTTDAVAMLAERLMQRLSHALARDGVGARALRLSLYRVDGEVRMIDLGLAMPTRSPAHVGRLFALKLARLADSID